MVPKRPEQATWRRAECGLRERNGAWIGRQVLGRTAHDPAARSGSPARSEEAPDGLDQVGDGKGMRQVEVGRRRFVGERRRHRRIRVEVERGEHTVGGDQVVMNIPAGMIRKVRCGDQQADGYGLRCGVLERFGAAGSRKRRITAGVKRLDDNMPEHWFGDGNE